MFKNLYIFCCMLQGLVGGLWAADLSVSTLAPQPFLLTAQSRTSKITLQDMDARWDAFRASLEKGQGKSRKKKAFVMPEAELMDFLDYLQGIDRVLLSKLQESISQHTVCPYPEAFVKKLYQIKMELCSSYPIVFTILFERLKTEDSDNVALSDLLMLSEVLKERSVKSNLQEFFRSIAHGKNWNFFKARIAEIHRTMSGDRKIYLAYYLKNAATLLHEISSFGSSGTTKKEIGYWEAISLLEYAHTFLKTSWLSEESGFVFLRDADSILEKLSKNRTVDLKERVRLLNPRARIANLLRAYIKSVHLYSVIIPKVNEDITTQSFLYISRGDNYRKLAETSASLFEKKCYVKKFIDDRVRAFDLFRDFKSTMPATPAYEDVFIKETVGFIKY